MSTTQWEYRILTFGSTLSRIKDEDMEAQLNEWGEEGWEVVTATNLEGSNKVRVVAKRALTTTAQRKRRWPDQP